MAMWEKHVILACSRFFDLATCKKVWHKSYTLAHCLSLTPRLEQLGKCGWNFHHYHNHIAATSHLGWIHPKHLPVAKLVYYGQCWVPFGQWQRRYHKMWTAAIEKEVNFFFSFRNTKIFKLLAFSCSSRLGQRLRGSFKLVPQIKPLVTASALLIWPKSDPTVNFNDALSCPWLFYLIGIIMIQ